MKKKILFVGCSFTANCGFTEVNRLKHHWPNLLANHYDCDFKNIAIGGMSNEEIFLRATEEVLHEKYDLVVVMWSSLSRRWVYTSDNNIDDFTIINKGEVLGLNNNISDVRQYAKLHYTLLDNLYMDLKKWLIFANTLAIVLQDHPFIYIKGFNNLLSEFKQIQWSESSGFGSMSDSIRNILDFDNRPDDYILTKIKTIKQLIKLLDNDYWLNFNRLSFSESAVDTADDNEHPGIVTNLNLVNDLINYIDNRAIL